jgi:hypothetical protein
MLQQYNQIKKVLLNFSFVERNKKILVVEIIANVLEEMRGERKIMMVLKDSTKVDEYIDLDITEININNEKSWQDLDQEIKFVI